MSEEHEEPYCICPAVEVRRRMVMGTAIAASQCLQCGRQTRVVPDNRADLGQLPPWDEDLRNAWRQRLLDYGGDLRDRYNREWREKYDRHIASDKWRQLRRKVLAREGNRCQGCGENPASEIHHRDYSRFGDELLIDLVALCPACHDRIHSRPPREQVASEGDMPF